jgi:hypothetical protein
MNCQLTIFDTIVNNKGVSMESQALSDYRAGWPKPKESDRKCLFFGLKERRMPNKTRGVLSSDLMLDY